MRRALYGLRVVEPGDKTSGLLPRHVHPQLGLGVGDQLAADVDGDAVEGAGERERACVVGA